MGVKLKVVPVDPYASIYGPGRSVSKISITSRDRPVYVDRSRPVVSVGISNLPISSPGAGVSSVFQVNERASVPTISTMPVGGSKPSNAQDAVDVSLMPGAPTFLNVTLPTGLGGPQLVGRATGPTTAGQPGVTLDSSGRAVFTPRKLTLPTTKAPIAGPAIGGSPMALDLGNLLGQLGGEYIQAKYGQQQTVGLGQYASPTFETGATQAQPALGLPFVDVVPDQPTSCGGQMLWKPPTATCAGKWIKRSRRRRKRLATASDIKDIAALKATAGPAILKTWIATHPS